MALSFFFLRGGSQGNGFVPPVSVTLDFRLACAPVTAASEPNPVSISPVACVFASGRNNRHWPAIGKAGEASLAQPLCQRLLAKLLMRSVSVWPAPAASPPKVSTAVLREDG